MKLIDSIKSLKINRGISCFIVKNVGGNGIGLKHLQLLLVNVNVAD
jgi:hypothetical protein